MKITIVGSDPSSLALAVMLARTHTVTVLERDHQRVEQINSGRPPLPDPYAQAYLYAHRQLLHIKATPDAQQALRDAALTIVGEAQTAPQSIPRTERLQANTAQAHQVLGDALPLNPGAWFVLQGLVPLGLTTTLRKEHLTPNVIRAPYMGGPAATLESGLYPRRIVVGACTGLAHVYAQLMRNQLKDPDAPILLTGSQEAEAIGLLREPPLNEPAPGLHQLVQYAGIHGLATRDLIDGLDLLDTLPVLDTPQPQPAPQNTPAAVTEGGASKPRRPLEPATFGRQRTRARRLRR
ncbi:hypothetical protein [Hydrogenophaga sp.]|uniref:hypothetical protein n=1 Tax=Hydrogenophaga sp. TaxID=1904254 RepID=UPI00286D79D2|nr:hypothetical protein [Hydrogenophaga sp.]